MKTKLIAGLLLAGSCLFAAPRISFGIGIGAPVVAPAPVYVAPAPTPVYVDPAYVPPAPGPGYTWIAGYYVGGVWRPGYWGAPHAGYFAPRAHFRR